MAGGNRSAAAKKAWITRNLGSGGRVPRTAAGNALIPRRVLSRKRGGSVAPRRILMADGTYRVGGKSVLPKGVGRVDRSGRVTRSATIGGMLIRFKQ